MLVLPRHQREHCIPEGAGSHQLGIVVSQPRPGAAAGAFVGVHRDREGVRPGGHLLRGEVPAGVGDLGGRPVQHRGRAVLVVDEDVGGIELPVGAYRPRRPVAVVLDPALPPLVQRRRDGELGGHRRQVVAPLGADLLRRLDRHTAGCCLVRRDGVQLREELAEGAGIARGPRVQVPDRLAGQLVQGQPRPAGQQRVGDERRGLDPPVRDGHRQVRAHGVEDGGLLGDLRRDVLAAGEAQHPTLAVGRPDEGHPVVQTRLVHRNARRVDRQPVHRGQVGDGCGGGFAHVGSSR